MKILYSKNLVKILKDIRKKVAKEKNVPPFVIFQDPSLEDMAIQYPITKEELQNIAGVGPGKAAKYGAPFLELIKAYVEETWRCLVDQEASMKENDLKCMFEQILEDGKQLAKEKQ